MSVKTDKLKLEFTKLTDAERRDFIAFIADYERSSTIQKGSLNEALKRSLGPTDSAKCACCGR